MIKELSWYIESGRFTEIVEEFEEKAGAYASALSSGSADIQERGEEFRALCRWHMKRSGWRADEAETFDAMTELQADMVDICNEYSKGLADKIFIYAANEELILAHHFYCINKKILDCHKLNDAGIKTQFDVSIDCQEQVLDVLDEDIQKIQALCEKHNKPVPKLMKLVYEPKTKKFTADYKYENQTTDDVSEFDNADAWFEEEKAKLE